MRHSRLRRSLVAGAIVALLAANGPSSAVRINPDGHGQALIYPYYTARSVPSGNAYVTALSVTNATAQPKALKVRFMEGKAGAPVLEFNLYLAAYDVWTAGVLGAGAGAGIFTTDHSCTSPPVSGSSTTPTVFGSGNYANDGLGASLDRTYEGFFEVLEMGVVDPASTLTASVTPVPDFSGPNASKPSCANLPQTDTQPTALSAPTGGLIGNVSYINVNEGTDYSADAIALSQWSDKVQWGGPTSSRPDLRDASPFVSYVVDSQESKDLAYVTTWTGGEDAVTALFMVTDVANDFSVEPAIKAATEWIFTTPTKRFYVTSTSATAPFAQRLTDAAGAGEFLNLTYYDREQGTPGALICQNELPCEQNLPSVTSSVSWLINGGTTSIGTVLGSRNLPLGGSTLVGLNTNFINGWAQVHFYDPAPQSVTGHRLIAPAGKTTIMDTQTGVTTANTNVTYHGLPVLGFSTQSYSTTGLPGINPNVLSNYGGLFNHKYRRTVTVTP